MIKAVILDFDDTLCLTQEAAYKLENEVLRRMGRSPIPHDVYLATWGMPIREAISTRSPGADPDEFVRIHAIVHKEMVERGDIDAVSNENLRVLDQLAEHGKELMILTSRTKVEARHLLEPTHALTQRITAFYHKDNTTHHKPDPRVFDVIERDHGLSANECVYVGDSLSDAAAAKGAGLHFIACLESGLRQRSSFETHGVDAFIDKFTDLYQAVLDLDAGKSNTTYTHEDTGLTL